MRTEKKLLVIDASDIDKNSYEALEDFAEMYSDLPIGKLVKEWIDYNSWDFAVWYIGYDV